MCFWKKNKKQSFDKIIPLEPKENIDNIIEQQIRNYRPLSKTQIEYLLTLNKDQLKQKLELYSECNKSLQENFNEVLK